MQNNLTSRREDENLSQGDSPKLSVSPARRSMQSNATDTIHHWNSLSIWLITSTAVSKIYSNQIKTINARIRFLL